MFHTGIEFRCQNGLAAFKIFSYQTVKYCRNATALLLFFFLVRPTTAAPNPDPYPVPPIIQIPAGAKVSQAKAIAIKSPRPEYPYEARRQGWGGVSWYLMHVDKKTGIVTRVEIKKSCGHKILDQAGADAFARWRFKPGTVSKIKCPITWTLTGKSH